jgi:hypothetical protein
MDLYFQGVALINRGLTTEYITKASDFFERALALDPSNVLALEGTALVNWLWAPNFRHADVRRHWRSPKDNAPVTVRPALPRPVVPTSPSEFGTTPR